MRLDISVILPVLFRKPSEQATELLARALDSVISQDYPADYEILVVDDGSATSVLDLFAGSSYARHPNIKWMRLKRNLGLVHALNRGLISAKHELIARIDADDRWCSNKIAEQVRLFQQDPELSIVGSGMRLIRKVGSPHEDLIRPGSWQGIIKFFLEVGCPFPHGSIVARRSVFKLLGGYPHDSEYQHCEDFALWSLWLRFFKPAMVEKVLYEYSVSDNSVSGRFTEQQRKATGLVHKRFTSLGAIQRFPDALRELSLLLHLPLLDVGRLCFIAWKYRPTLILPRQSLKWLRVLMPDRGLIELRHTPPTSTKRETEKCDVIEMAWGAADAVVNIN